MADLFTDTVEPIIPSDIQVGHKGATPEEASELTSQAVLAGVSLDVKKEDNLKVKAHESAVFEGPEGVRALISETDYQIRQRQAREELSNSVATNSVGNIADQMLAITLQEHDKFALENNAVNAIKSTLPKEILDVVDANILEDIAEDEVFNLKVRNFISSREIAEDDENLLQEAIDFFKEIVPIQTLERLAFGGGVGGITNDLRDIIFSAKGLPEDQQDAFLRTHAQKLLNDVQFLTNNPQSDVDLMRAVVDGSGQAEKDLKFWQGVGVVLAPFEVGAGSMLRIAKKLGNLDSIADDVIAAADERIIIKSEDEVYNSTSSLKAPFDESDSVDASVLKNLDRNERLLRDTLDNFTAPEGFAKTQATRTEEFNSSYGGNRILRSSVDLQEDGILNFVVGTQKGTPYKSEKVAQRFIDKYKLDGKVAKHPSGGFSIKMKSELTPGISSATATSLSYFGRNFGNIDNVVANLVSAGGRAVEGAENQIAGAVQEVHKRSLRFLSTKKAVPLLKIIQDGVDANTWLTPSELKGAFKSNMKRAPTPKELESYYSFKQLSDFDWELKNKTLYDAASALGQKQYNLNIAGGRLNFNAAKIDSDTVLKEGKNRYAIHVFEDIVSDSVTIGKGTLDSVGMDDLIRTHDLLQVDKRWTSQFFEDGVTTEPTKWVFVPKGTKASNLATHQMPYKAGGRRVNNPPAFLKAAKVKKDSSGSLVRVPDIALFGATSIKNARKVADNFQELFTKLKGTKAEDLHLLDDLVEKMELEAIGISTAKQAHTLFKSRGLFKYDEIKFSGVRDRERVTMDAPPSGTSFIDDTEEPIYAGIRNQMNGMRGDRLKNLDGEDSIILDPMAALAESLDTAARFSSVSGYRDNMLTFMKDKFGRYLNIDPNANPIELLTASINKSLDNDPGLRRVITAHQRYIEEIISKRTRWEEAYVQKAQDAVDYVFDKGSFWRTKLDAGWIEKGTARKSALDKVGMDPAGRVKNLVFNAKLGMFNPAAYIIQAINITNIMALSPKYGSIAAKHSAPARLALTGGVDGKMKSIISKGWKEAGFKSEDDFFEYINEFKHLGLGVLGKGIADIGAFNGSQLGTSAASSIADASRFFFNEGEIISRLTSYGAARLRWLDDVSINKGNLSATSPEGRLWIQNETHRLSLGLSRQDVQLGFRGLAGLPTQFWSYPFRLIGSMFGKSFTTAEKSRLFATQAFLYGSAGIPIVDMAVNHYTAKDPDMDVQVAKALTNGAIDSAFYALTDGEVNSNFAGRAGVGQFVTDMIKDIRDKSFGEFVSGAGGQTISGIMGTIYSASQGYGIFQNPEITNVGQASWAILKSEISSLKLLDKVDMALRFGYLFDKNGMRYAKLDDMSAWLMVGGLPPQAYENVTLSFLSETRRREVTKDLAGWFVKLNQQAAEAISVGNFQRVKEIEGTLHILGKQADEYGITSEVMNKVRQAETSEDLLSRRVIKAHKYFSRTPTDGTPLGVNQNVLKQELGDNK